MSELTVYDPVSEYVKAGAELLDEKKPDWYTRVDLDTLDIGLASECVLGQVFGYYTHGLNALDITGDDSLYGFSRHVGHPSSAWDELNECWAKEIVHRLMKESA